MAIRSRVVMHTAAPLVLTSDTITSAPFDSIICCASSDSTSRLSSDTNRVLNGSCGSSNGTDGVDRSNGTDGVDRSNAAASACRAR